MYSKYMNVYDCIYDSLCRCSTWQFNSSKMLTQMVPRMLDNQNFTITELKEMKASVRVERSL